MERWPEINTELFRDLGERMLLALREVLTDDEVSLLSQNMLVRNATNWVDGVVLRSTSYMDDYEVKASPVHLLHIRHDFDSEKSTITIEDLEIAESRRGQGIGTVIVQTFLDFAKEKGLDANASVDLSIEMGRFHPDRTRNEERLMKWLESLGMTQSFGSYLEVKSERSPDPHP